MFDIILSIFSSFSKENQVLVCAKLLSLVGVPLKTISIILHISLNSLRSILKGKKKKKRSRKTLDITEKILQIFKTDPLDYAFAYWTCGNIVKVLPSEGIKVSRETVRLNALPRKQDKEIAKLIAVSLLCVQGKFQRFFIRLK